MYIQPETFSGTELSIAQLIQRRRLQLLVHSCIYYELDRNIISDTQFDLWGKELVELQANYPNVAERICYHEAFKNWEGNTGAFLPYRDPWVLRKARYLLQLRGEISNEHTKVLQSTRKKSSQSIERKTPSKQRSNKVPQGRRSLF